MRRRLLDGDQPTVAAPLHPEGVPTFDAPDPLGRAGAADHELQRPAGDRAGAVAQQGKRRPSGLGAATTTVGSSRRYGDRVPVATSTAVSVLPHRVRPVRSITVRRSALTCGSVWSPGGGSTNRTTVPVRVSTTAARSAPPPTPARNVARSGVPVRLGGRPDRCPVAVRRRDAVPSCPVPAGVHNRRPRS